MAIKYINNIDLRTNELQYAVIQPLISVPVDLTAKLGQVYFNTIYDNLNIYTSTGWVTVGNGIASVTSGDINTITIGGTSSNPTISANTAAVTNGSLNLVTGDAVYDFVNSFGYVPYTGASASVNLGVHNLTATKLIKSGGSPTEFLMANGSVTIGNGGVYSYEIHVSQIDGSDTTGTGSLLNPFATITKALTLVTGARKTIIIHPGSYTESPNITVQYTVLVAAGTSGVIGGNVLISGTVSTSVGCTISGLKMTNLTITAPTGTGNVNILNNDITGTLNKSGTADYVLIRFCDIGNAQTGTGGLNITSSAGLTAVFGGNPNFIRVTTTGARVIVKNAITISPVLLSGTLTLSDCIIIALATQWVTGTTYAVGSLVYNLGFTYARRVAGAGSAAPASDPTNWLLQSALNGIDTRNGITTAIGTIITIANSQIITPTFQDVARVSLGGIYSELNSVYDRPNSTLSAYATSGGFQVSGSTNSIVYSQFINADKFIKQGGTPAQLLAANGDSITAGTNITISGGIISAEGGDILTNSNTGIIISDNTINNTIDTIYNTALDPSLTMPNAVGGIPALTTVASLSSLNLVQIFNDILFPTVQPTYLIPIINLFSTVTSIREIGQTFSPVITFVGVKNDAGAFSQLIVRKSINSGTTSTLTTTSIVITLGTAVPDQFGYTNPNNPNFIYTVSTTDSGLIIPAPASGGTSSTVTYSGLGDYAAGLAKKNNKGFNDVRTPLVRNTAAPQAAGTSFAPTAQTITGYYPYFYGKTSTQKTAAEIVTIIQSGTGFTKVTNNAAGSLIMAFGATGEFPWFATYSIYPTKTTWFENALNNGNIGGATDLFAAPTILSVVSSDGYWTTTFKIYPSNKVTTLGTATIA